MSIDQICEGDQKIEEELTHTFSFTESDHLISLTESQLQHIPYLNALVSNADKFVCTRNEHDIFVLHYPIQHVLLNPILSAALDDKPSHLFMKLPRHTDVVEMLHLYKYFCVDPLVPLSLRPMREIYADEPASFSKNYQDASPSEARDTAVEFVVAITNETYDLNNVETVNIIFDLVVDILSFNSVFGPRLRYQTLIVAENYCWHIFTRDQQALLRANKQSVERLDDSGDDPDDDTCQTVEAPSHHLFRWRRRTRFTKPRERCSTYLLFSPSLMGHSHSYSGYFEDRFYLGHYRAASYCRQCYSFDSTQRPLELENIFYWLGQSSSCKRCEKRDRFSYFQDGLQRKISCLCGHLRDWVEKECEAVYSKELKVIFEFYRDRSSSLSRLDFKVATYLMQCCGKSQSAKDKRARLSV